VERVLVLLGVAILAGALVAGGRVLAAARLRRLREAEPGRLWTALQDIPDGRPTVVAFSTPSCAACHSAQRPALTALQQLTAGRVRVVHVDAAERPHVATAFGVMTVPATVVLDRRGEVLAANQGFATAETLAAQATADTTPAFR
jgi:thiol-disulfide isomerase/thioredoxin